jgi:hypothetical protein
MAAHGAFHSQSDSAVFASWNRHQCTPTNTPGVHDAQWVGGSSPSWRTPKFVGNWRILLRQGPPFLRFEAVGEPKGFASVPERA